MIASGVARVGRAFLGLSEVTGGLVVFAGTLAVAFARPRPDGDELWANLHRIGVRSLPVVAATAAFAGAIAVIQTAMYIVEFRAYEIIGWAFGYSVLREIGPLLIGLMFSGRVGANTTAELGTMAVTEQIDALRAMAIDPMQYLVLPRIISMVVMMTLLCAVGMGCAIVGGLATSWGVVGIDPWVFWNSFREYVTLGDFVHGMVKATCFGLAIGIVSCHFGLAVRGGAAGVGRAVNACVVASAVGMFVLDFFVTWLLG